MALITLTETKTLLQITDTSKDSLITALIPIIEDEVKAYCRQDFVDAPAVPSWKAWMKLPASKMIAWHLSKQSASGMQSESIGTYSYTQMAQTNGYPEGILESFDKAKIVGILYSGKRGLYRDMRGLTTKQIASGIEPRGNEDLLVNDQLVQGYQIEP